MRIILSICFVFFISTLSAQIEELSNLRKKQIVITSDTMTIDTLSIILGSEILKNKDGSLVSLNDYVVNYAIRGLHWHKSGI